MVKVGRMAATDYNREAARAFKRARDESGMNQGEFAGALSDALRLRGRRRLKQSTLSGWEIGTRQVPAGALIAAADVAGVTVGRALARDESAALAARVAELAELVARAGASATPDQARRVRAKADRVRKVLKP